MKDGVCYILHFNRKNAQISIEQNLLQIKKLRPTRKLGKMR